MNRLKKKDETRIKQYSLVANSHSMNIGNKSSVNRPHICDKQDQLDFISPGIIEEAVEPSSPSGVFYLRMIDSIYLLYLTVHFG